MSASTPDPLPGDLAATLLAEALADRRLILLSPGRVPGEGFWAGWQAGTDVFLERLISADLVDRIGPDRPRDFRRSYRALLAEGEPVRLVVPTMFVGGGDFYRIDAISKVEKKTVVRLPASRLGRDFVFGREEDFDAAEKTLNALHDVLGLLLGLRGVGTEKDTIPYNVRRLAPYVAVAKSRRRRS